MHRQDRIPKTDVSDLEREPTESSRQEFDAELDEKQNAERQEQDVQVLSLEHMEEIMSSLLEWKDELTNKERLLASKEKRLAKIKKELDARLGEEHKENQQSLQKDDAIEEEGDDPEKMQAQIKQLKSENRELSNIIKIAKAAVASLQEQLMLANSQAETRNKLKKIHKLKMQEKEKIIEEEKKKIEELVADLKSQKQTIQRLRLEYKEATTFLHSEIPQQDEESKELVSKHEKQLKEKIAQMEKTISELKLENSTLVDIIGAFDSQPLSKAERVEKK